MAGEPCSHCGGRGRVVRKSIVPSHLAGNASKVDTAADTHNVEQFVRYSPAWLEMAQAQQSNPELCKHPQQCDPSVRSTWQKSKPGYEGDDRHREDSRDIEAHGKKQDHSTVGEGLMDDRPQPEPNRSDTSECDQPHAAPRSLSGSRRSSRRRNTNVLYDQKYHPMDQSTRPNSAISQKHRGIATGVGEKAHIKKRKASAHAQEGKHRDNSQPRISPTRDKAVGSQLSKSRSPNEFENAVYNMEHRNVGFDPLSMTLCPSPDTALPTRSHKPSNPPSIGAESISRDSPDGDPRNSGNSDQKNMAEVHTMFTTRSVEEDSKDVEMLEPLLVGDDSYLIRPKETQSGDEELGDILDRVAKNTSRAIAALKGNGTSTIVLAPNSSGSVSPGANDLMSPLPSTPVSRRIFVSAPHRGSLNDLPDTGFLRPDGSPSNALDLIHGLTPPPRPAPDTPPSATRGTPPGLRSPRYFSQPTIPSERLPQIGGWSDSRRSSLPPDYLLKPYGSAKAKRKATLAKRQDFLIFVDGRSGTPSSHVSREFDEVLKENDTAAPRFQRSRRGTTSPRTT